MSESALKDCAVEAPLTTPAGRSERKIRGQSPTTFLLPIALGILGTAVILAVYLTILGLAQGWGHAVQLLREDAFLVAPITLSFGVQVGARYLVHRGRFRGTIPGRIHGHRGSDYLRTRPCGPVPDQGREHDRA